MPLQWLRRDDADADSIPLLQALFWGGVKGTCLFFLRVRVLVESLGMGI